MNTQSSQYQMQNRRTDTEPRAYYRAENRLLKSNGQWFFATREGEYGPFPTEEMAHRELKRFLDAQMELQLFQLKRDQWNRDQACKDPKTGVLNGVHTLEILKDEGH